MTTTNEIEIETPAALFTVELAGAFDNDPRVVSVHVSDDNGERVLTADEIVAFVAEQEPGFLGSLAEKVVDRALAAYEASRE